MFKNVNEYDAALAALGNQYEALIEAAETDIEKERLKKEYFTKEAELSRVWNNS